MADIFISYAKKDREKVEPIAHALKEQGWSTFWDRAIPGGKTWDEVIEEELDAAKCVIVVWSKISITSRWVRAEAEEGLNKNILVPVSIEDVKIPLLFRPIQSVRLIKWQQDSNHPQFIKLISDLSPILGPSPKKVKETEQLRAEKEKRRKEQERKAAEEKRRKEQELKRKAEEVRKRKEIEEQRKIEEERKREEERQKRVEAGRRAEEKHEHKDAGAKPKLGTETLTEPKLNEQIAPEPRKRGKALKISAAGVVFVLLIAGIWWWFSQQKEKKFRLELERLESESFELEREVIKPDNTPQRGAELYNQKNELNRQINALKESVSDTKVLPKLEKIHDSLNELRIEVINNIGMKFMLIPAGKFVMGSPSDEPERNNDEKQHEVRITKPFYLQTTEVSQGQWKKVMGDNPSRFKDCGDDCPVEQVSWDDVQTFISKLNQMEGTNKYRLPTEAEWEYACRAETTTPFFTGDCISTDQANYNGNYPAKNCPKGAYREKTLKVGSFQPNAWGLYDMHGNVWEWCQDWYGDYPSNSVVDPKGPDKGKNRVFRGGSWNSKTRDFRSANRHRSVPGYRDYYIGFRVGRNF